MNIENEIETIKEKYIEILGKAKTELFVSYQNEDNKILSLMERDGLIKSKSGIGGKYYSIINIETVDE